MSVPRFMVRMFNSCKLLACSKSVELRSVLWNQVRPEQIALNKMAAEMLMQA